MQAEVHRLSMQHPGDLSALAALLDTGRLAAADIVAVIGKTEGNGGVNDFTRGYFTQTLMALLARHTGRPAEDLLRTLPCVLSGGTEGVLSPHYLVFSRRAAGDANGAADGPALAVGTAFSAPLPAQDVGRAGQIRSVADTVRRAMADARIDDPADVAFVQVKCPCVTVAGAQAAIASGQPPLTTDPNRSMAYARAAGALGVGLALGDTERPLPVLEAAVLADFGLQSPRASVSSGVEVPSSEVIVLGRSRAWQGPLRIACVPMADALDVQAVQGALAALGLPLAGGQLTPAASARLAGVLVKCEPDRRGQVRGRRHTMLDDTDINAQRHVRGAVGGLVAGVLGETQVFVSGGAEHQGPDGGGLIAVLARAE